MGGIADELKVSGSDRILHRIYVTDGTSIWKPQWPACVASAAVSSTSLPLASSMQQLLAGPAYRQVAGLLRPR